MKDINLKKFIEGLEILGRSNADRTYKVVIRFVDVLGEEIRSINFYDYCYVGLFEFNDFINYWFDDFCIDDIYDYDVFRNGIHFDIYFDIIELRGVA